MHECMSVCVRVCLSVCLSLSLCQTNLHMRVALQAPPNKQNCARSALPAAEEAQQQVAPQLWIPALASVWSACAVCSARSSWVLHRPTACGLHCPFAAAVATKSRSTWCLRRLFHKSHDASFSPLLQRLQPLLVLTHFRCNFLRAGFIQSCCRTPGNQETTPKMAHSIWGAASLLLLTQSQSSRTWRSKSA